MHAIARLFAHGRTEAAKAVVGQRELVDHCLITLLCGGHALIEGVPGVAKTLTVKLFSKILGLRFQRLQCTSDLMPADILGTNVLNTATSQFNLHQGPVFSDFLLVDEINRMPPRTQAALLECMEERQVTIDGTRYDLGSLFTVFATQNPIEFEGTYPLPEAQLDRFLLKMSVQYPEEAEEIRILENHHGGFDPHDTDRLGIVPIEPGLLEHARRELRAVNVEAGLFRYLNEVVRKTRNWPSLSLGASPRAGVSLLLVAKAIAAGEERDYVIPDDVKKAVLPVLRHRLVLKPEAELEGVMVDRVVRDVVASVEVPK
jgi:MoxR-like ATPase